MLSNSNSTATPEILENYYKELEGFNLAPLWNVQEEALVDEPTSKASPHIWRWKDLEPKAIRAGELIGTADAERRVLMLLNPAIKDRIATTNSLFSGLQIVMPGEAARAHRHTPSALRFIINSDGGYTTVNGDRIPMYPGDLVLTPSWTWHDHSNESGEPIIWLDGLDIPLV
ncbi:MAG: cupin domain-containing protein, partial [Dehalococcoidia bacterium]|nr:cupin domain-containing protein [Dehalococcoidia bacterium]